MRWTSAPRASENPARRTAGRHDDHVGRAPAARSRGEASGGGCMELAHEFTVNTPIDQAWAVLTDVERIAPCMPGAELREVEGDEYRGIVKIKVGPITAQYQGKATITEKDASAHRIVVRAEGRDTRGQGNANATVTATLAADGASTKVNVLTDLNVTGKVAQFG